MNYIILKDTPMTDAGSTFTPYGENRWICPSTDEIFTEAEVLDTSWFKPEATQEMIDAFANRVSLDLVGTIDNNIVEAVKRGYDYKHQTAL